MSFCRRSFCSLVFDTIMGLNSSRKRDEAREIKEYKQKGTGVFSRACRGGKKRPGHNSTLFKSPRTCLCCMGISIDSCLSVIAVVPTVLVDEIEAAEAEGNDDRIEGVLCGAAKQLKMNRAKPDPTLYLSLMYLAKIKPNIFATEGVIEVRAVFVLINKCDAVSPRCADNF